MDMPITTDVELRKRPGASGKGQQVWIAWKYANVREIAYAEAELKGLHKTKSGEAMARSGDHPTAGAAARSIKREETARVEGIIYNAILRTKRIGLIWDEAERLSGVRPGSSSPRWKSLRKQRRIVAALED